MSTINKTFLRVLLAIACCGIDIEALMHGAQAEREDTLKRGVESAAVQYAMSRQALYADGKNIEILAAYEPAFRFMAEWWKQLYGESEGKDGKGIFPASVDLTPDLHSMGQYIQDGIRMLQETVVFFDNSRTSVTVPSDEENLDGLNYLAGREMSYINEKAMQATKAAHISGGVPVTEIRLPEISMYASNVSALPCVRAYLLEMQRDIARKRSVIMDGRDIGTVVLPDADLKIYLTASAEERARRRCLELSERGTPKAYEEVLREINERDYQDMHRDIAPLREAEDAVHFDTSKLNF